MYRVLHVALEGGPASFGGLGNVATQMFDAQNNFMIDHQYQFDASIITPLYPELHKNLTHKILAAEVEHLFNYEIVKSKIYLTQQGKNKYYMVEPPDEHKHLFDVKALHDIYFDLEHSFFIDRLKFFNSAVAAYIGNGIIGNDHPNPQILQLHDWQASLVPKLLTDLYNNKHIKTVFMVHIDNYDRGSYPWRWLQGLGIEFNCVDEICVLKAVGLMSSDQVVVVSPRLLQECITTRTEDNELEFLRKIYTIANVQGRAIGITNGINYNKYCPIGKLIDNPQNIYKEKLRNKYELANGLRGSRSQWQLDPILPLILYVGRYSQEKGVDSFEQVIKAINGRANFIAIGRSMTNDVYKVMLNHSRQNNNVFISFNEAEQAQFIAVMRAAADFVYIPSRREACGLVGPEGMANGAICITTGIGGLRDVITPLNYSDPNNTSGNGLFYEIMPEDQENPDIQRVIDQAINMWQTLTVEQKNAMQLRIMTEASKFDWKADDGALFQYLQVFKKLLPQQELQVDSKYKCRP